MNHRSHFNGFDKLLQFLSQLDDQGIDYTLAHYQDDAMMVLTAIPGERWEIAFFRDGQVEIERFVSQGNILNEAALQEFFAAYSDASDLEPLVPLISR